MEKNLKYFMVDDEEEIITIPGIEKYKDENGEIVPFQIRVLSRAEIEKITKAYEDRRPALDNRNRPIIQNGEVAFKTKRNDEKWERHLIAEALVYPNLKDKELMDWYKCVDITEMPLKVFKKSSDYVYVRDKVMAALGFTGFTLDEEDVIEEVKN